LVILGGIVVVVLFAALIGPYFIDWNNYKATFETAAERILGQPVHVRGTADAGLLPSPSMTFTDVEVGDREGRPMMTVARFTATLELMPLLQGQIHVVSMKLEQPAATVSVDDAGRADWMLRSDTGRTVDADSVTLQDVEIADGTLTYTDAASAIARKFEHITATVEASSLAGPWRIVGSYREGEAAGQFQFATGRQLADGSIRIKTDVTPPNEPMTIAADGVVADGVDGLSYAGTFTTDVVNTEDPASSAIGLHSAGSFTLKRERLVVDRAVLSLGSPDQPASLAGSMTVDLGKAPRFRAEVQARQFDLDRLLGKGPSQPIEVGAAAQKLVASLTSLGAPSIPGTVGFSVPTIVVGGSVVQDVRFQAASDPAGWQISGFHARLPGEAAVDGDGLVSTGGHVGFAGSIRLAVAQPAIFAAWWRGQGNQAPGRLLAPFDLAGEAGIEPGKVALTGVTAKIGGATISGDISWSESSDQKRLLSTDLSADRLDFSQVRSVAELLVGQNLADTTALADSYAIKLAANELDLDDMIVRGVSIDAGFVNGTVTVKKIDVGDLGGAHFTATQGEITNVPDKPRGRLTAHLDATTLAGLSRLADRVAPESTLARWLAAATPALVPLSLEASIEAPPRDGVADQIRLRLTGSAAATNFNGQIDLVGEPADWRAGSVSAHFDASSYSALGLARQIGLASADAGQIGSAQLTLDARGKPLEGMATTLDGALAGLAFHSEGKLALVADLPTSFKGTFALKAPDLTPLIRTAGLDIPGSANGTPLAIDGDLSILGDTATLGWKDGSVAGQPVQGNATIGRRADGILRVDGGLSLERADLAWLAGLALGASPLPTADASAPWSTTPFTGPMLGRIGGKLAVTAGRLSVGDLDIANASFALTLAPDGIKLDSGRGQVADGTVTGALAIRNVGGDVGLSGRFDLKGATLDRFIWQRNGRPVATGLLDLSADFAATGRSPAGLVATLSGGGALSISSGEVRYINPRSAALVVRASDLGQTFTVDALSSAFTGYIDAGNLPFGDASAAFDIASGTVRLKNMTLTGGRAEMVGGGIIDLGAMTLDSDWTLTLDSGVEKGNTGSPQVGLVFRGPLDAPGRTIDVLQFASFLNIRQTKRLEAILTEEEDARLEHDRFRRELREIRYQDQLRVDLAAEQAAERAAALATLDERATWADRRATEVPLAAVALPTDAEKAVAEKPVPDQGPINPSDGGQPTTADSPVPGPLPPIPPPKPIRRKPAKPTLSVPLNLLPVPN
jgi:uncharacterized protein involved in outer membrane biogenesis